MSFLVTFFKTIRSLVAATLIIGIILASLALFPLIILLWALRLQKLRLLLARAMNWLWPRMILGVLGARVRVHGLENLPRDRKDLAFVGNHQGYADILLVMGWIPRVVGFIGKDSLKWVPIINIWMMNMGCLFIDRTNVRRAMATIKKGGENISKGHAQLIFPEGTRSRSPGRNPFHKGSLKLATQVGAMVVPISIQGSYRLLEASGQFEYFQRVDMMVHPPIDTGTLSREEKDNLAARVEITVVEGSRKLLEMQGMDPALVDSEPLRNKAKAAVTR